MCGHNGQIQVTLRGNVGSLDATRASRLFTFGFGGRVLHREGRECSKKIRKNGETNGMLNLPIVPTHFTLRGNVGSLDAPIAAQLFTFGPSWQANALRGS